MEISTYIILLVFVMHVTYARVMTKQKQNCKYKKSSWSGCDPNEISQTSIQTLIPGSAPDCEQVKVVFRPCLNKPQQALVKEETQSLLKKSRKNNKEELKRKRKQKFSKNKELKKNKKRVDNLQYATDLIHELQTPPPPPPPAELQVIPNTTSLLVSWQPPPPDRRGRHVRVDSYKIGYGHGFPDLDTVLVSGAETTYTIQNLDEGREYIVSLRAKTIFGMSQALYETVRTLSAGDGSLPTMMMPVSVNPTALSSDAINVSWVDMSMRGEAVSKKREYFVRYRPLSHVTAAPHHNHFRILHTGSTFLVVDGLQPFTKYEFAVLASDGERNSSWSAMVWNVTHEEAPSAPEDLTIIPYPDSPGKVVLSWQPPSQANGILTGYQVTYGKASGQPQVDNKDIKGNKLSVTLARLTPGVTYDFSVRARNSQGLGLPMTRKNYLISEGTVAEAETVVSVIEAPRNLELNVLSPTSAVLSWQDPSLLETLGDDMDSSASNYTIRFSNLDAEPLEFTTVSSPFTFLYMSDLQPQTWYEFAVRAVRGDHESEWSLPVRNRTLVAEETAQEIPSLRKPENLQVVVMSSSSALVSWQDPALAADKKMDTTPGIHTYTLRYRDLDKKSLGYRFVFPNLLSIFMVDLQPATQYEFSVRTDSADQHSEWSAPVVNTTFESAPTTGPGHVTVSMDAGDPTTALLKWMPPESPNGDITGYLVFYETAKERRSATVPGGELSYRVPFLKPHTKYFFRIGARNSQGFSPLSKRVAYRTPRVIGTPPTDVTVSPAVDDPYNAVVSWQPPSPNKRKIKFYTVTHYSEDGKHRTVRKVPGSTLTEVVKKLLPSTNYHFTVQAHYQRGAGPHSTAVQYTIPKELLQKEI